MTSNTRRQDTQQEQFSSEELERLYREYFSSPAKDEADNLTQVSLFDYTVPSHISDSTVEAERHSASLE